MDLRLRESISNQNEFALHLSKHVGSPIAVGGNFAISPTSLHAILALIVAGSKGPILDQILSILRSKSSGDLNALSSQIVDLILADGSASGGPKIIVANGVWVDSLVSLKRGFKEIAASSFKAEARAVDFKTKVILEGRETINIEALQWESEMLRAGLVAQIICEGHLLGALGIGKLYGASNLFDWMELTSLQGKMNFFEKRVEDYQNASVMRRGSGISSRRGSRRDVVMFSLLVMFLLELCVRYVI